MEELIEKLKDLHKQATEERSHYYVGSIIKEVIDYLTTQKAPVAKLQCSDGLVGLIREKLAKDAIKYADKNLPHRYALHDSADWQDYMQDQINYILDTIFGKEEAN